MTYLKNNFKILMILVFLLNGCVSLPGIIKNPSKKEPSSKIISSEYSMNDVGINIIKINSLSDEEIDKLNKDKIDELDFKVKTFQNIYNYKYEYILGPADKVFIDLTDTDDLDGTYLIDQEGMIDLPFIGKVKLDDLTLNEAQNILLQVIQNFIKILIFK